jgi:hypothetical protein
MDEVDFTILAATSVLGDLIEKCPPAEACRDAFNRMSKATVQMCISTTGFGSGTQGLNSRMHSSQTKSDEASRQFDSLNPRSHRASSHQQRLSNALQLSPPISSARDNTQFGVSLSGSYSASSGASETPNQNQTQQPYASPIQASNNDSRQQDFKKEFNASDAFGISGTQIHSPSNYAMSPPQGPTSLEISAIDPSLLPSPQAQAQQPQLQPSPFALHDSDSMSNLFANASANFNDLDFHGMDFLMQNAGADAMHDGFAAMDGDLGGLRLGWEYSDHDFSEGNNNVDPLDGFFFGGPAAGYGQG